MIRLYIDDGRTAKICVFHSKNDEDGKILCETLHNAAHADIYQADYDEDVEADLHGFDLVVFLLNAKLFEEKTERIRALFGACVAERINVIPVLSEKHLNTVYENVFGAKQYLLMYDDDPTALPFHDKLSSFLNESFAEKSAYEKVKTNFSAHIFLSYRKKDRELARKLMFAIHENPLFRNVAIWFDEYLTPGENWSDEISSAISGGDLVILMVTPNMVNEDNYVIRCEYPACREKNKPCMAIEMAQVSFERLCETFEGLNKLYSIKQPESFFDDMRSCLKLEKRDLSELEKYYLGLAYLFGILTEKNIDYALNYIEDSANASCVDAMKRLSLIYKNGICGSVDGEKAMYWQERTTDYYKNSEDRTRFLAEALDLDRCYYEFGQYGKMLNLYNNEIHEIANDPELSTGLQARYLCRILYYNTLASHAVFGRIHLESMTRLKERCSDLYLQTKDEEDLRTAFTVCIMFYKSVSGHGEYRNAYSAFSNEVENSISSIHDDWEYSTVKLAFNYFFCKAEAYIYIDEAMKAKSVIDSLYGQFDLLLPVDQLLFKSRYHELNAMYYNTTSMGHRIFDAAEAQNEYIQWIDDCASYLRQTGNLESKVCYANATLSSRLFSLFNGLPLELSELEETENTIKEILRFTDSADVKINSGRACLATGILNYRNKDYGKAEAALKAAAETVGEYALQNGNRIAQRVYFIAYCYMIDSVKESGSGDALQYIQLIHNGLSGIFDKTRRSGDFNNLLFAYDLYTAYYEEKNDPVNMWKYKTEKNKLMRRFKSPFEGLYSSVITYRYTRFDFTYLPDYKTAEF